MQRSTIQLIVNFSVFQQVAFFMEKTTEIVDYLYVCIM